MSQLFLTAEDLPDGEYAIVEIMGHTKLVGRIAQVERFGTKLIQVEPLFCGMMLPPVYHGGASIFGLTPCSKERAWKARPQTTYSLPTALREAHDFKALPAPEDFSDIEDGHLF